MVWLLFSELESGEVIATQEGDKGAEFIDQRMQAMVYNDNGNFNNFHEFWLCR